MIDLEKVWIPGIVDCARTTIDDNKLRIAWSNRTPTATSVTSFDEILEQIFEDLDSENQFLKLKNKEGYDNKIVIAIGNFINMIKKAELLIDSGHLMNDIELLDSEHWQNVRRAAIRLVSVCR